MSTPQDPEENLPDWLKAIRKNQGKQDKTSPPEGERSQPPDEPNQEPEWLQEVRRLRGNETEKIKSERALSDTQPSAPSRTEKRPLEPKEENAKEQETPKSSGESQLPSWLDLGSERKEIPMRSSPAEDAAPPFRGSDQERLSPGELPSWLQALRPGGPSYPDEDTRSNEMLPSGEPESTGPLAGLSGVLKAEPEISKIQKAPVFSNHLEVSESQYRHAAVLRDLLDTESQPKADEPKQVARSTRVLNRIVATALIVAVLIPIISNSGYSPRLAEQAFPEGRNVFDSIESLHSGSLVLIGFDEEPAFYGEMKALLRAVFSHLLDKQVRLVFISTQPTGPALAELLLHEEFPDAPAVLNGNYTSLGYIAGGMAALRSFSSRPRAAVLSLQPNLQDPWLSPALESINGIDDFALVLVLTSDAEDGRSWIEQVGPATRKGIEMVSSAQAAPALRAYLSSAPATLRGLVSGLMGGIYYEQLRGQEGSSSNYWASFSYGLGAIFLLVLLGGLHGRVIQLRPRETN